MPWTETARPHYEPRCRRYASDLTDAEWALVEPLMPTPSGSESGGAKVGHGSGGIMLLRAE